MIGLYIHIPFCLSKCKYCDFVSYADKDELMNRYISKLISESKLYKGEIADTVFIGGGTPARLPLGEMSRLVEGIRNNITIAKDAEFTVEVNPNSVTKDKIREYSSLGINRISIGLQTADDALLKRIGRTHCLKDFFASLDVIRQEGITNINADMMYSLPSQTVKDVEKTANIISSLDIPHISAYSLILEEGTPLFEENPVLPSEDEDREMFYLARDVFASKGIFRYEISNFAKQGYECRHNLKYWRLEDYIGLGVSAHSCYKGMRSYNSSDIDDYLNNNLYRGSEAQDAVKESIMLKLRLKEGISMDELPKSDSIKKLINNFLELGLADVLNNRLALTDKGMDIQNYIVSEIFLEMES